MTIAQTLLNSNLEEASNLIRMKEILDMPLLHKFSGNEDYIRLEKINSFLKNKNITIKTLKAFSKFNDYLKEDIDTGRLRKLMLCFQEQTPNILNIMRKNITELHQLKEVIPSFEIKDKDNLVASFNKIQKYNRDNFISIMRFLNYKKIQKMVLNNRSVKNILFEIEKIKLSLLRKQEVMLYKKDYAQNYKIFLEAKRRNEKLNYTYIPKMEVKGLEFIKCPIKADFWGKETLCCLKKGGVAESLIDIIEKSPIAGELVGKYKGKKLSSYVWDMVDIINGKAYKTLILDNIEANKMIPEKELEEIFDRLYSYNKYKHIYLGTVRNDCEVNKKYEIKKRQSTIVGYDEIIKKNTYTHADSDRVYIMRTHEDDNNIVSRKMNISDLHLCKYIENYIYGKDIYDKNDKTDILKQVTLDTPCYIIDSTTNIFGYFLTKWKFFDKNNKETFSSNGKKKLYIEDIVVSKNKMAILELKNIFKKTEEWLLENKIKEVYMNTNNNSKNFVKRLERIGIKVVMEDLETIVPKNYLY